MSTVSETKSSIGSFTAEAFAAHLASLAGSPAWWLERKRAAYEKFTALPLPKRTDESWRFSNIATLTLDGFELSSTAKPKITVPAGLRAGRIVSTLTEAAVKRADLLKAHFMAQPQKLGSEKFAALHTALVGDGAFIYVPRGGALHSPI